MRCAQSPLPLTRAGAVNLYKYGCKSKAKVIRGRYISYPGAEKRIKGVHSIQPLSGKGSGTENNMICLGPKLWVHVCLMQTGTFYRRVSAL